MMTGSSLTILKERQMIIDDAHQLVSVFGINIGTSRYIVQLKLMQGGDGAEIHQFMFLGQ